MLIGKIGRVEELDELASVFAERGAAAPDPRRTIKALWSAKNSSRTSEVASRGPGREVIVVM